MTTLLDRLAMIKEAKARSVRDFAIQIGCNQPTVDRQLKGERSVSIDTIVAIAKSFPDVSMEWLIRGIGDMIIVCENNGTIAINNNEGNNNTITSSVGSNDDKTDSKYYEFLEKQIEIKDRQIAAYEAAIACLTKR